MVFTREGGKRKGKKGVACSAAGQDAFGAGAGASHGTAERQRGSADSQVGREGLGTVAGPPVPRRAAASQSFGRPALIARGAAGGSAGGSGSGAEVRWPGAGLGQGGRASGKGGLRGEIALLPAVVLAEMDQTL